MTLADFDPDDGQGEGAIVADVALDAPGAPAAPDVGGGVDDDVAGMRARAKMDLQAQVIEAKREHDAAVEAAAKREREDIEQVSAFAHHAEMKELQDQLDAYKRTAAAPSRLLTESRLARMDKAVPRPPSRPVRLGDAHTVAPPRDVERPARVEEGSVLPVVRFLSLNILEL